MPLNPDCASLGVYDIYRICFLFWVSESERRRAAKKHKGGRARRESSALICWHGNTDFFVSPRRERRQRILGITGMMTGGKHAQTDTETGARLSHIKIQGRSNNLPSRNERGGFTPSLSFSQFYYKHLYKSYVLPFISLVVFFLFFSRPNFFLPFVSVAARAARGIRLALCGPDFRNRRQAACIPRYEQPGKEGTNNTLGGGG